MAEMPLWRLGESRRCGSNDRRVEPDRHSRTRPALKPVLTGVLGGRSNHRESTSTEMTMLIELNSDNRTSLRTLFDRYPYVHGSVAAVIEGGMGRVFADAQEEPSALTSPGTAYAKHANGAAIALGILGGALAERPLRLQVRRVLRGAADVLPTLCVTGLFRRAGAGLFLRAAASCLLCSGAVLRARVLLQRLLKSVPFRAWQFSASL